MGMRGHKLVKKLDNLRRLYNYGYSTRTMQNFFFIFSFKEIHNRLMRVKKGD